MTKKNPYHEYIHNIPWEGYDKIAKIARGLINNWDFINSNHPERTKIKGLVFKEYSGEGDVSLFNLLTYYSYSTGMGSENFSEVLVPVNFDKLEVAMRNDCEDPDRRSWLNCLPSVRSDRGIKKLEDFFQMVLRSHGFIIPGFGLPTNLFEVNLEEKGVLCQIAKYYKKIVQRSLPIEEYNFLQDDKTNYQSFLDFHKR